ncbi:MAG: hypothetical protein P4L96_07655 [Rhodoferax sp.]|nr:hypothetical protein [Rhodoferax sp.]
MFCSGCGQALVPGQAVCTQCGRPVATPVPPVPNLDFQLQNYASRIRALSIVWFIYGGLSLALGLIGLGFLGSMFNGFGPFAHGPWAHGPWGENFFGPAFIHMAFSFIVVRAVLAFIAGWGLVERTQWGRVVAIVAAFFCLLKIPVGTALGIWTLVTLLGYRNSMLYEQLEDRPR